jgi:L-asparaginase II
VTAPVVAEVVRNGFVESVHHGSVVALAPDGSVLWSLGDVRTAMFPRSSSKPLQAVGMLRCGLGAVTSDPELLAVVAASHSGTPYHVGLVERLLEAGGRSRADLDNTPALPYDESAAQALLRAGGGPDRLHQNCSGKHAGMVVTAAHNGWPVADYRSPEHPLQRVILETLADLSGDAATAVAVDGCGAPLASMSLIGLARAFARLVQADDGTPQRAVADAMRAFPEAVGGSGRTVTAVMRSVPGLLAKDGAEGVYAAALPDGTSVALKVADGAARAAGPVLVEALRRLGVDGDQLDAVPASLVMGAGSPVGEVRVSAW